MYYNMDRTRPGTHQVRDVARTPTVLRGIIPRARAMAMTRFDSMAQKRREVVGKVRTDGG